MSTVGEVFWERRLSRTLTGGGPERLLVLVEGAEGTGKTALVRRLAAKAAGGTRVLWARPGEDFPALPESGPVLLVAEDVDRAEADHLSRLRDVVERPVAGLAALVTYRPEGLAEPGFPLGTPRPRYPAELVVLRHRVASCTREQVGQAAVAALGDGVSPEAVAWLHEHSGGVAQVVVDVLAVLRDSAPGRSAVADVEAAGVPVRLAEQTLARTAALPAPARPVVWAAAVLEGPATRREVLAVADLGEGRGREALLAAVTGSVLSEDAEGRYGFAVPLAGRAVREALAWPLRQELHGRAAGVLAARHPVPWQAVAQHRKTAGHIRGWLRAVERAARKAAGEGRHQEAVTLLEETLASQMVPQTGRARLAPILASSAVLGLRVEQAVQVMSQIVDDEMLPDPVRGEIRLDLGLVLCNQVGKGDRGWKELEQATAELREIRPDLAARGMVALGSPWWTDQPLQVHMDWLKAAEEAAEASGEDSVRVSVGVTRAMVELACGRPEGWDLLRALPTDSDDVRIRQRVAAGWCGAADAVAWLGYDERAAQFLDEGVQRAAAVGDTFMETAGYGTRLVIEWHTGQWSGLADRCAAFVAETSEAVSEDARLVLAMLCLARGEWAQTQAWTRGREELSSQLEVTMSGALVRLALARADVAGAAEAARTAWAKATRKGLWVGAGELTPWAVEAIVRAEGPAQGQRMVDAFAAGVADLDVPADAAGLLWARAVHAETSGTPGEAAGLYRQASAAYAALQRPYPQALTAEGAGRCRLTVLAAAGGEAGEESRVLAVDELSECVRTLENLGATWDAARARAVLREHQPAPERRPPGRPSYGDQLSPREREVAELASTGMTNREIATTLHLSHRTVEQHIARAMRKLDTDSRRDLDRPR